MFKIIPFDEVSGLWINSLEIGPIDVRQKCHHRPFHQEIDGHFFSNRSRLAQQRKAKRLWLPKKHNRKKIILTSPHGKIALKTQNNKKKEEKTSSFGSEKFRKI